MSRQTPAERRAQMFKVMQDPDLDPIDQLKYLYHWYWIEMWGIREARAEARRVKHAKKLNQLIDIFNFTKDLAQL